MSQTERRSKRKGQALAEMAVMVPFLVIAMMGMLDLGRAFYYQISLVNAVREAARYGAQPYYTGLTPACNAVTPTFTPGPQCPVPGDDAIKARMAQELSGTGFLVDPTRIVVSPDQGTRVTNCGTSGSCQYALTVTATYQFNFITPIIGDLIGNPLTLKTSAQFRTEY
ncbi:MAG TPA: TadE/TadG family type IV pilus assembly protein [Candidatus Dormibacteraeota bacterium]|nr:TadE/TadG family type IV pilus assembly protein [Candidatus Dormibacteraeota bacterium]